ncbi:hypothetical protein BaRGS_00002250 [Batillaria attramentaria]|uniref:Hexosyltransferase n=1 Tax=Batillaria attramentaria TaxID=370345 RepID=A0ABD0M5H2_9CAEN
MRFYPRRTLRILLVAFTAVVAGKLMATYLQNISPILTVSTSISYLGSTKTGEHEIAPRSVYSITNMNMTSVGRLRSSKEKNATVVMEYPERTTNNTDDDLVLPIQVTVSDADVSVSQPDDKNSSGHHPKHRTKDIERKSVPKTMPRLLPSQNRYDSILRYIVKMLNASEDANSNGPSTWLKRTQDNTALHDVVANLLEIGEELYLSQTRSYFTKRPRVVNSFLPKLILQAQQVCPRDDLFLLIVVPSVVHHFEQREAIRRTWARPLYGGRWPKKRLRHSVKLVFFFGVTDAEDNHKQLKEESELYGDIVQVDFAESYRNLSLKMAAVLYWSATYCPSARHLLKVDEDTFVNLPFLLDLLVVVSAHRTYYALGRSAGTILTGTYVFRQSKWAVDVDVYPFPKYPVYFYGHSYIISGDAISDLLDAYQHMPLMMVEDAFFTGILAKTVGMTRIHSPHFAGVKDPYSSLQHRCKFVSDQAVSQTGFKPPSRLYKMWEIVNFGACPLPSNGTAGAG